MSLLRRPGNALNFFSFEGLLLPVCVSIRINDSEWTIIRIVEGSSMHTIRNRALIVLFLRLSVAGDGISME